VINKKAKLMKSVDLITFNEKEINCALTFLFNRVF